MQSSRRTNWHFLQDNSWGSNNAAGNLVIVGRIREPVSLEIHASLLMIISRCLLLRLRLHHQSEVQIPRLRYRLIVRRILSAENLQAESQVRRHHVPQELLGTTEGVGVLFRQSVYQLRIHLIVRKNPSLLLASHVSTTTTAESR